MTSEFKNHFAITPLDGRYHKTSQTLQDSLSEAALIHYRLKVELLWTDHLLDAMEKGKLPKALKETEKARKQIKELSSLNFREEAHLVKEIEATTNHDVKACEYYLQKLFEQKEIDSSVKPWIHFACTSEDINNLAYGLMLKDVRENVLLENFKQIEENLSSLAEENKSAPLLSRTHGQAASPTTLGKEVALFYYRLKKQREDLESLPITGKINGAVGNYNAHQFVFPEKNWHEISKSFVEEKLGLTWNPYTTQIESHDSLAKICQNLSLTSSITIGLCQDIWSYVSTNVFGQKTVKNEVGSSTMPHKVNPIDFENAEGNFGIARSLFNHLAEKLPISRRQRDLSDSTVQRSLGTAFGHFHLAQKSLLKGLGKLEAKRELIKEELDSHWEVLAEPIQMLLRRYGVQDAYEQLKAYSRGKALGREELLGFIQEVTVLPEHEKKRLLALTPSSYLGLAEELTKEILA